MYGLKDGCFRFSNVRIGPVVSSQLQSLLGVGVFNSDGMHTRSSIDTL